MKHDVDVFFSSSSFSAKRQRMEFQQVRESFSIIRYNKFVTLHRAPKERTGDKSIANEIAINLQFKFFHIALRQLAESSSTWLLQSAEFYIVDYIIIRAEESSLGYLVGRYLYVNNMEAWIASHLVHLFVYRLLMEHSVVQFAQ